MKKHLEQTKRRFFAWMHRNLPKTARAWHVPAVFGYRVVSEKALKDPKA